MAGSRRLSRDQKRKAKLAVRAKRRPDESGSLAYSGSKYREEGWAPHVFETESAIHETILLSERRLTNDQVETALTELIGRLRVGEPALLPENAEVVAFSLENAVSFLICNVRRHWRTLFENEGRVSNSDLVGILRTLLYSIQAHAWNRGKERGYVSFLCDFFRRV